MSPKVRFQLSVMMFLQFFIWGAWYVPMGVYLGALKFPGSSIGWAYSTTALAAIVSPFFVGMIADRFFSAQKVLGIMHITGGIILYLVADITSPLLFLGVLLAYTLTYMPTLALVNTVAFNQMESTEKQFPAIRVWGTIGWIVAGLVVGFLEVNEGGAQWHFAVTFWKFSIDFAIPFRAGSGDWISASATSAPMVITAAVAIVMGLYSFVLPNTPPSAKGKQVTVSDVLGLDALRLLRDRSFAVLVLSSLFICIPLAAYYGFANQFLTESGMLNATAKMSLGQGMEVLFMLVMPFFLLRLGVKKMLLIGMLAWVARYGLFAFGDGGSLMWMLFGGILLHGICYDFFFVTGQIYVDNEAPESIRASAQGLIAMVTYGIGMFVGSVLSGRIVEWFEVKEAGEIVGHNWQPVWLIMAAMAAMVIVFFALLFRDKPKAQEEVPAAAE